MELRHLRYFAAVAQHRSFVRAAEVLHIAQPPLSRQIRQLEDELGAVLFERGSRPLQMTPVGRFFHQHALAILERVEAAKVTTRRFGLAQRRQFLVGFVGSTLYGELPEMVRRLRAGHAGLTVDLIEMTTLEQLQALKEGRIDLAFGRLRFDDPAIRREVLVEEGLAVALPPDHALRDRPGDPRLADIAGEPLVLYPSMPRPSYADQVLSLFRDRGLEPLIGQEVRDVQTALGLVAAGVGVCLVPASLQRLRRDNVVYRPLDDPQATSPIIMSWRATDTSAEVMEVLALARGLHGLAEPPAP
jgi:DNA-binding transcriptional LysR family regulator